MDADLELPRSAVCTGSSGSSCAIGVDMEAIARTSATAAVDLVRDIICPRDQTADVCRFMDVSKQVIGSVLVHILNLLLSMLSSGTLTWEPSPAAVTEVAARSARRHLHSPDDDIGDDDGHHSNPCSFYLLNLGIDVCVFLRSFLRLSRL